MSSAFVFNLDNKQASAIKIPAYGTTPTFVAHIDKSTTGNVYRMFSVPKYDLRGRSITSVSGNFTSPNSKNMLEAIHSGLVINQITYKQVNKHHLLLQPDSATDIVAHFLNGMFIICTGEGLRDKQFAGISSSGVQFLHASPIDSFCTPNISLATVFTSDKIINVLTAIINKFGSTLIKDFLLYNSMYKEYWKIISV